MIMLSATIQGQTATVNLCRYGWNTLPHGIGNLTGWPDGLRGTLQAYPIAWFLVWGVAVLSALEYRVDGRGHTSM